MVCLHWQAKKGDGEVGGKRCWSHGNVAAEVRRRREVINDTRGSRVVNQALRHPHYGKAAYDFFNGSICNDPVLLTRPNRKKDVFYGCLDPGHNITIAVSLFDQPFPPCSCLTTDLLNVNAISETLRTTSNALRGRRPCMQGDDKRTSISMEFRRQRQNHPSDSRQIDSTNHRRPRSLGSHLQWRRRSTLKYCLDPPLLYTTTTTFLSLLSCIRLHCTRCSNTSLPEPDGSFSKPHAPARRE